MNILICDDDKLYVDMIRKYVDEFFADHKITDYKVYEYNSGDEVAKNNERLTLHFLMLRWTELMELKLANI